MSAWHSKYGQSVKMTCHLHTVNRSTSQFNPIHIMTCFIKSNCNIICHTPFAYSHSTLPIKILWEFLAFFILPIKPITTAWHYYRYSCCCCCCCYCYYYYNNSKLERLDWQYFIFGQGKKKIVFHSWGSRTQILIKCVSHIVIGFSPHRLHKSSLIKREVKVVQYEVLPLCSKSTFGAWCKEDTVSNKEKYYVLLSCLHKQKDAHPYACIIPKTVVWI